MRCERGLRNLFNKASGHGIPSQNFYSKNEVVDNAGAVYDGDVLLDVKITLEAFGPCVTVVTLFAQ